MKSQIEHINIHKTPARKEGREGIKDGIRWRGRVRGWEKRGRTTVKGLEKGGGQGLKGRKKEKALRVEKGEREGLMGGENGRGRAKGR